MSGSYRSVDAWLSSYSDAVGRSESAVDLPGLIDNAQRSDSDGDGDSSSAASPQRRGRRKLPLSSLSSSRLAVDRPASALGAVSVPPQREECLASTSADEHGSFTGEHVGRDVELGERLSPANTQSIPSPPRRLRLKSPLSVNNGSDNNDDDDDNNDERSDDVIVYDSIARQPTGAAPPLLVAERRRRYTDDDTDDSEEADDTTTTAASDGETRGLLSGTTQPPRTPWEQGKRYLREGMRRLPYYIPVFGWLPHYNLRQQGLNDLFAGLAVGLMLVPQAISYALIAKVPPVVGLYSGFMPLVIYAIFGSSMHLGAGPEGLLSLLVGSTLTNFARNQGIEDDPVVLAGYANILCIYVGLFTLVLGIARVGFFDNLFSRPILNGFVTASALIIMVEQLGTFWGIHFGSSHTVGKLEQFFTHFTDPNVLTLCIGVGMLLLMVAIEHLKSGLAFRWPYLRIFPTTLVIVVVGIALGAGIRVDRFGVAILGHIKGGFPTPELPPFWDYTAFRGLFGTSLLIATVGYVEAMAASKMYAAKHNYIVSPNRELVAFGAMNLVGGCFQAYPVFASLTRSSVSDIAGAKSQMAVFVTSLVALATLLFLMPLFYYLPKVVASAIVMFAASKLIHVHILVFLWRIRAWIEIGLAVVTLLLTFFLGPEVGILVALGMSLFIVVKATTIPHCDLLGFCPDSDGVDVLDAPNSNFRDLLSFPGAQLLPGVLLFRINDDLCFANIASLQSMLKRAERLGSFHAHPTSRSLLETPTRAIVFDASNLTGMDAQSLQIMLEMLKDYSDRNITFAFAGLDADIRQSLLWAAVSEYQSLGCVQPDIFFASISQALQSLYRKSDVSYSSYKY